MHERPDTTPGSSDPASGSWSGVTGACLVLAALLTGLLRPFVPSRPLSTFGVAGTYEAFAHLVLGALLAAWLLGHGRRYGLWAATLTLLETVLFLMQ